MRSTVPLRGDGDDLTVAALEVPAPLSRTVLEDGDLGPLRDRHARRHSPYSLGSPPTAAIARSVSDRELTVYFPVRKSRAPMHSDWMKSVLTSAFLATRGTESLPPVRPVSRSCSVNRISRSGVHCGRVEFLTAMISTLPLPCCCYTARAGLGARSARPACPRPGCHHRSGGRPRRTGTSRCSHASDWGVPPASVTPRRPGR